MWGYTEIEDEVSICQDHYITNYFLKYLPKDELILEAGCGLGAWVIYLKGKGYNIEGIDHDEWVISRLKKSVPDLAVQAGDICRLPYRSNSLGAYISLGVLEHFEDGVERPMAEARRVLKPGGLLILTLPFNNFFRRFIASPLRSLYLLVHRLRGGRVYFAEYRYSSAEARKMIEKAGFHVVGIDINDFIAKDMSLALWSEFPFLRDQRKPYSLKMLGKILAYLMNSISRRIVAAGILVIAKKPAVQPIM